MNCILIIDIIDFKKSEQNFEKLLKYFLCCDIIPETEFKGDKNEIR